MSKKKQLDWDLFVEQIERLDQDLGTHLLACDHNFDHRILTIYATQNRKDEGDFIEERRELLALVLYAMFGRHNGVKVWGKGMQEPLNWYPGLISLRG